MFVLFSIGGISHLLRRISVRNLLLVILDCKEFPPHPKFKRTTGIQLWGTLATPSGWLPRPIRWGPSQFSRVGGWGVGTRHGYCEAWYTDPFHINATFRHGMVGPGETAGREVGWDIHGIFVWEMVYLRYIIWGVSCGCFSLLASVRAWWRCWRINSFCRGM